MKDRISLKEIIILNLNGKKLPASYPGYTEYFGFENKTVENKIYFGGCKIINATKVVEYTMEEFKVIEETKQQILDFLSKGIIIAEGKDGESNGDELVKINTKYWSKDSILDWDNAWLYVGDKIKYHHITIHKMYIDKYFFNNDSLKNDRPKKLRQFIKSIPATINTKVKAREYIRKHFGVTKDDKSFSDGCLNYYLNEVNTQCKDRFKSSPRGNFKRKK